MDIDALFDQMQAAIERIDHPRFFGKRPVWAALPG